MDGSNIFALNFPTPTHFSQRLSPAVVLLCPIRETELKEYRRSGLMGR